MKVDRKTLVILSGIMIGTICVAFGTSKLFASKNNKVEQYVYMSQVNSSLKEDEASNDEASNDDSKNKEEVLNNESAKIVYDGLTIEQLSDKLNRSLKSVLANQGNFIATYSLEKGVDPYLATAIMLHETGCASNNCSSLVTYCNNVGGMKGSPGCGGGSYSSFETLEEGIRAFIDNLAKNYYSYGLTTPELMNSKYAASTTWATRVNAHITQIKSR